MQPATHPLGLCGLMVAWPDHSDIMCRQPVGSEGQLGSCRTAHGALQAIGFLMCGRVHGQAVASHALAANQLGAAAPPTQRAVSGLLLPPGAAPCGGTHVPINTAFTQPEGQHGCALDHRQAVALLMHRWHGAAAWHACQRTMCCTGGQPFATGGDVLQPAWWSKTM